MRSIHRLGGALAVVVLMAACGGSGATTAPSVAPASHAATPAVTVAPPTAAITPAPTAAITAPPSVAPSASAEASASAPASQAPAPSVTPSPTLPPGAAAGTLTIWADNTRAPVLTDVAKAFTAATGVPVKVYEIGFGQIRDGLVLNGPAGTGPDIVVGANDWLGKLVTAGVVEPLDLGTKASSFEQSALTAFTYEAPDGTAHLYGMPEMSEAIALYYNKDLVPTAPTTWDDLKTMATDLQTNNKATQGFCMQRGDPYHTEPMLTGFGGYVFGTNSDGSYNPAELGLDSPGALKYAEQLDAMVKAHILVDNVDYGACATQMEKPSATASSAMWITGPWELANFEKSGINFGVAPIPTMDKTPRPFVGVQGFMVSAFAPNKLLAKSFLTDYVATDDTFNALWAQDKRIPAWKPVETTVMASDPYLPAFAASAKNADPLPAIPQMDSVWTDWTNAINLIFAQSQAPDSAMQDAASKIRALIGGASPAPSGSTAP